MNENMQDYDQCEAMVNKFGRQLVAKRAAAVCKRVTRAVVHQLRSMPTPIPEIFGMKSIWQDICVQLQYDKSIEWDAYEYEAKSSVERAVDALNIEDMTCVWLQTRRADEMPWQDHHNDDSIPIYADDVIDYILSDYVFKKAIDSEDRVVRAWIDRQVGNLAQEDMDLFHQNMDDSLPPPEEQVSPATYTVMVDDNFHFMDQDERWKYGEFTSLEAAIEACKSVVDECLADYLEPNMTPDQLYSQYKMLGDDPYVVGPTKDKSFSSWDYAEQRSKEICQQVAQDKAAADFDVALHELGDILGKKFKAT